MYCVSYRWFFFSLVISCKDQAAFPYLGNVAFLLGNESKQTVALGDFWRIPDDLIDVLFGLFVVFR